jgi:hypothetical protein
MPASPHWHKRIPAIRAALAESETPFLDRPAIEKLFRLQSRRAQSLMKACGGTLIGRSAVVGRHELLAYLDQRDISLPPAAKERRHGVLVELRQAAETSSHALDIPRPLPFTTILPDGITLPADGKLLIEYNSAADLLAKVFALTQTAQKDVRAFQAAVERAS